uniref:YqaJ viral recombinase family protein n=1 Tax=Ningiella ruwaisensis TaxID=2364274 RepID=UPI00109FC3CF|nr:YqaJ viral recombinase family protein [Ningiella ruwaisensis]
MKQIHQVKQGEQAWLDLRTKYFTASEAAAMLGLSKYQTRNELLHAKSTGETKEISEHQQKLFNKGHEAEELARVIAEREIGEELYPVTYSNEVEGLPLLASMDGIDMMESMGWEHKLYNAELFSAIDNNEVPDTHWPQLEHQMLVSECNAVTFSVSDGNEDNYVSTIYVSKPERRKQVIEGWKQFAKDLADYVPEPKSDKVEATPVRDLPSIRYQMDGLSLKSNLDEFKSASDALVELSKKPLESDQDFADAESRQKVFTKAEKNIKDLQDKVLGEVADIDAFTKDLRYIGEQIRQARLAEGKQIKERKEQIRQDIARAAFNEGMQYRDELLRNLNLVFDNPQPLIIEAMKGKKTVESLQNAADTAIAQYKIQVSEAHVIAQANYDQLPKDDDLKFLFNDWPDIAFKDNEDFKSLVHMRVSEHQKRQAEKLEQERQRIREEEQAKAQREAAQKQVEKQPLGETPKPEQKPKGDWLDGQVKYAQSQSEPALTQYQEGYIQALRDYASWKDGTQYVGTCGKTLDEAIKQFLAEAA